MMKHKLVITRQEALAKGVTQYFNGKPCRKGHVAERGTNKGDCLECKRAWFRANVDHMRKLKAEWKQRNLDKEAQRQRESNRRHYALNPEHKRAIARESHKRMVAERNAESAKRRANKIKATPSWADHDAIEQIFKRAKQLNKETGLAFHVDHIIPLKGKNVCGLHVETNLQILQSLENLTKGNKHSEGDYCLTTGA